MKGALPLFKERRGQGMGGASITAERARNQRCTGMGGALAEVYCAIRELAFPEGKVPMQETESISFCRIGTSSR